MGYSIWMSNWYDFLLQFLERPYLHARRARLLNQLSGSILEVGVGTGVNLEHYTEAVQLIGVEPSSGMLEQAQKKRKKSPAAASIQLHQVGIEDPLLDSLIPPHSLDYVVCTLVLCTVPDPSAALVQFQKWLKPDGKLLILEHLCSTHPGTDRFQDRINPLWKSVAGGCNLNRKTDELILSLGYQQISYDPFSAGLRFVEAVYQNRTTEKGA